MSPENGVGVSWDKYLGWYWRCTCEPTAYCYDTQAQAVNAAAAHRCCCHSAHSHEEPGGCCHDHGTKVTGPLYSGGEA